MGIDGFSMSNLGLNRNLSSAQLAHEVDFTANQALENQLANLDGVGKKEKAGRKNEDAAFNGTVPFIADEKEQDEDENAEETTTESSTEEPSEDSTDAEQVNEDSEEEDDDDNETEEQINIANIQCRFKLNEDGLIEVWNTETNQIIRTIRPEDAAKTLMNTNKAPSIFVNRVV